MDGLCCSSVPFHQGRGCGKRNRHHSLLRQYTLLDQTHHLRKPPVKKKTKPIMVEERRRRRMHVGNNLLLHSHGKTSTREPSFNPELGPTATISPTFSWPRALGNAYLPKRCQSCWRPPFFCCGIVVVGDTHTTSSLCVGEET